MSICLPTSWGRGCGRTLRSRKRRLAAQARRRGQMLEMEKTTKVDFTRKKPRYPRRDLNPHVRKDTGF
jgi:hypothetical protein